MDDLDYFQHSVLLRASQEASAKGHLNFYPNSVFCKEPQTFTFEILQGVTATVTVTPCESYPRSVTISVNLNDGEVLLESVLGRASAMPLISDLYELEGSCITKHILAFASRSTPRWKPIAA